MSNKRQQSRVAQKAAEEIHRKTCLPIETAYLTAQVIDRHIAPLRAACLNAITYMEKTSSDPDTYHKEMMQPLRKALEDWKIEHE